MFNERPIQISTPNLRTIAKGNVQYQGHYRLDHSSGSVWRDWVYRLFVFFQLQRSLQVLSKRNL